MPITPADRMGACVDYLPIRAAFPAIQPGRHPRFHFRGLHRLHSRYGPPGCSTAQGGLCHEASIRSVTQPNRSSATRPIDNYLSGTFLHGCSAPSGRTERARFLYQCHRTSRRTARASEKVFELADPYIGAASLWQATRQMLEMARRIIANRLETDPIVPWAHVLAGGRLWNQHKTEEATTEYRKAMEIDSRFALPHIGLGNAGLSVRPRHRAPAADPEPKD
jgi:hypothetical protein